MPTWQEEFPDYSVADMPAIPPEWNDVSWHNDACPCFEMGLYLIWIDYADQVNSETQGMPRFGVASDAG